MRVQSLILLVALLDFRSQLPAALGRRKGGEYGYVPLLQGQRWFLSFRRE